MNKLQGSVTNFFTPRGTVPPKSGVAKASGAAAGIIGGLMDKAAADHTAAQLLDNAGAANAAGQRASIEQRRQKRLIQSRAQAVSAAGGGDTTDISTQDALADIEREGEFRALTALFEGRERAAGLRNQAKATKFQGKQSLIQGGLTAVASLFG